MHLRIESPRAPRSFGLHLPWTGHLTSKDGSSRRLSLHELDVTFRPPSDVWHICVSFCTTFWNKIASGATEWGYAPLAGEHQTRAVIWPSILGHPFLLHRELLNSSDRCPLGGMHGKIRHGGRDHFTCSFTLACRRGVDRTAWFPTQRASADPQGIAVVDLSSSCCRGNLHAGCGRRNILEIW